MTYSYDG